MITTKPKITWSGSFSDTINFGYMLDNPTSWPQPRQGSEFVDLQDGSQDAWITGTDYYLRGSVRWIPTTDTGDPVATGWDGVSGWKNFLIWARNSNVFRFYPDKDGGTYYNCYLVNPTFQETPALEADGTRRLNFVIKNPSSSFDGY